MKNPPERITAREGINAAQAFFERPGCVFQEGAQQNDFGKDAYVDIGGNGSVSFLCVAIQVKAGVSYRTAKGDYFIPVDRWLLSQPIKRVSSSTFIVFMTYSRKSSSPTLKNCCTRSPLKRGSPSERT